MKRIFSLLFLATFICLGVSLRANDTYAETSISCSTPANTSIESACKCTAGHCGALWMNGSKNGGTSEDVEGSAEEKYIYAYVHGAVKTNNSATSYESYAHHLYFLTEATGDTYKSWNSTTENHVKSIKVDYLSVEGSRDVYRGAEGANGKWSTGWEGYHTVNGASVLNAVKVKINVKKFIQGADAVLISDGAYYFTREVNLFRCYSSGGGCGTDPSYITIKITPKCNTYTYNSDYTGSFTYGLYGQELYQGGSKVQNQDNLTSNTYYIKDDTGGNDYSKGKISTTNYQIKNTTKNETKAEPGPEGSEGYLTGWSDTGWGYGWSSGDQNESGSIAAFTMGGLNVQSYHFGNTAGLSTDFSEDKYHASTPNEKEVYSKQRTVNGVGYGSQATVSSSFSYNKNSSIERTICKIQDEVTSDTAEDSDFDSKFKNPVSEGDVDTKSVSVTVKNPYNFGTSVSTAINGNGTTVIGGGQVNIKFNASILARTNTTVDQNSGYYTKLPAGTQVKTAVFLLNDDMTEKTAEGLSGFFKGGEKDPQASLCDYIKNSVGANNIYGRGSEAGWCEEDTKVADVNTLLGSTPGTGNKAIENTNGTYVVPDVDQGNKYCAVMAITRTDSHGNNGTANISGDGVDGVLGRTNDRWNISNVSCRTIARVPSFQVWGGAYTSGGIQSIIIKKIPGATFNTPASDPGYLFGSWAENIAVANGNIKGFSSGAAIGYNSADNKGGLKSEDDPLFYNVSKFTVANSKAKQAAAGQKKNDAAGTAGNVIVNNSDLINRVKERYASSINGIGKITENIYAYGTKVNDFNFNEGVIAAAQAAKAADGTDLVMADATSNKVILNNKSLVVFNDGDITISDNICTGVNSVADCGKGAGYTLSSSNRSYNAGSDPLPQVIIIATGNVNIKSNVNQIDAWIITPNEVDTCSGGSVTDGSCDSPLIVNGPVLAKDISLKRTHGGNGYRDWGNDNRLKIDTQIFSKKATGSSTPAEIFNLRPDVYQWIYQQTAIEDKAAIVRYARELAPRY